MYESVTLDEAQAHLKVLIHRMNPYWVEVPMLYAMSRWGSGLIGMAGATTKQPSAK